MEAYITPGAIMPSFEIRKELQIRYLVDRRHIYDYFHSRGLRVAKEDRHSNLARHRATMGRPKHVKNTPSPVYPVRLDPSKRLAARSRKKRINEPAGDPYEFGSNSVATPTPNLGQSDSSLVLPNNPSNHPLSHLLF